MANAMPAHNLASAGPATADAGPRLSVPASSPLGVIGPLEEARIRIEDGGFNPPRLTIPVGATVTWTNVGRAANTVTSATRVFASTTIETNRSYSYRFNTPGTYEYFSAAHPHLTAQIVVRS